MSFLTDTLDSLKGIGKEVATTTGTALIQGVGNATTAAINKTVAKAGQSSTAVPEQHGAVVTGQNANGSTVVMAPASAGAGAGMPGWAVALLAVSSVAVIGGGLYLVVKK